MLLKSLHHVLCKTLCSSVRPNFIVKGPRPNSIICQHRQARALFTMEEVEKGFREDVNLAAVCQMTATEDKDANFRAGSYLVQRAAKMGAKGPVQPVDDKIYCAHVLLNPEGEIASVYRKAHLFQAQIEGRMNLQESSYVLHGEHMSKVVDTPLGKVAPMVCYDVRFPEMSTALTQQGAEILTYPSAFTQLTGMAHWEVLLRSRAIENQCYVIAAAQTGKHHEKRASYGRAMIVDPWGCIVACCHDGLDVAVADIDLSYLRRVRTEMPVMQHRRHDLYGRLEGSSSKTNDDDC